MKVSKLFCGALLAGALAVSGCGDDGGGSSGNGNGNGAAGACSECDIPQQIPLCENGYNVCIQDDAGTPEDCAVAGLALCTLL
jgi:S-adenosylhomocysteine hydrolase